MAKTVKMNREAWLTDIGVALEPIILEAAKNLGSLKDKKMPKWVATVGFPSRGALSSKKRVIGQCWPGMKGKDGSHQLFISPVIHEEIEVVGTMAHEMGHAFVGCEHGHKGPFPKLMTALGLTGKPTATVPGPEFIKLVKPLIKTSGKFDHTPIVANPKFKAQSTRLLKAACTTCGYTVRVTKKWVVNDGTPICPTDKIAMTLTDTLIDVPDMDGDDDGNE
jgi:hypothetical protein